MDFWLVSALLTFVAILIVMLPLTRKEVVSAAQGEEDRSVYIQQLKEIDSDLARGLLDEQSAAQARLEISRRILKNDRRMTDLADGNIAAADGAEKKYLLSASTRWVVVLVLLFIPALSWGIYAAVGTPDLPSQPLADRKGNTIQDKSAVELIAQAEAHLANAPDDGRGWAILAPIYMRLGRVDDAINAYRKALELLGKDVDRLIGLGEALTVKANGQVTAEALALFEEAGKVEPKDLRPPLMKARALLQAGKRDDAIDVLQIILNTSPEDALWRADIEQTIANLKAGNGSVTPSVPAQSDRPTEQPRGPTAEDVEAAASLNEQGRKDMIRSMVDGLAERLRENPANVDGWERLLRAYVVLGEQDNVKEALRNAAKALPENDMRRLTDTVTQLGVDVTGVLK
ncbi:c-type cytochrome biogenesis protein CcmI [Pseudochrobactrum asaccharolyticum]|uniref:c-type cytochrome biogenesis protein CcmI n=1 Tax=Pseudochrobactrum asaccharolyticum TaxID=354351 RepID=UPI004043255F